MENPTTVLSFGGGQDSTAILYKCFYDNDFIDKYVKGELIVVYSNTRNEHSHTYSHIKEAISFCKDKGIPFFTITPKKYASGNWRGGLVSFYKKHNAVGSKAFPKTCTDNLKIRPIYKFLEEYVHNTYSTIKYGRKSAFYEYKEKFGKMRVLIGIAKGEEKRASDNGSSPLKWFNECIDKSYPLLEEGMNREDCQVYIKSLGFKVPYPSNCILCPFMSLQELLYLYRYENKWYNLWCLLEENKIKANSHKGDKNLGIWGTKKLLPDMLQVAVSKFGDWDKERLIDYKMSHGHCVKSRY